MLAELRAAAEDLIADPPGAVVITGGERIFAAGADISEFGDAEQAHHITAGFHAALNAVAEIPRFVIAAVSGYALGGGCELALACDYRIAGERAVFGQPEILLGIIPGGGGTQRLPRLIGAGRAKEMMITGRQVKADEALRIGLADEVVPSETLHERALALAAERRPGRTARPGDDQASRRHGHRRAACRPRSSWSGTCSRPSSTPPTARSACAASWSTGPGKAEFTGS